MSIVRSERVENQIAPTFASLFTGGGLADVGAMAAGYKLLWGVEYDPAIAAVANANLPHADQVYAESVVGFDWAKVERPDHLHMSPPCQDFSVAKSTGKASNDNDALAQACIDAIKALEPSTVTLENVEGYRKAKGFQAIVDALWGLGYWVNVDVLNSADMGVPQTRRRLILRAVKGGFPGPLPEPVRPWKGWYQAIEDLIPTLPETQFAAWQLARLPKTLTETCFVEGTNTIRDATIRTANEPRTAVIASEMRRPISTPKAYLIESKNANQQYGDGVRESHQPHTTVITDHKPSHQPKAYILGNGTYSATIDHKLPAPTITSNSNQTGVRAATSSGRVVRMTPRALARFQTMPDWYTLPNEDIERFRKMGDDLIKGNGIALACKIIGNGVPCLMMQRVMETF